jgi:hypothetical protein
MGPGQSGIAKPGAIGLAKRAGWAALLALASGAFAAPASALQSTDEGEPTENAQPTENTQPTGAAPLSENAQSTEQNIADNIRATEDATILKNRFWFEGEWNNDQNGASSFEGTFGVRLGWRISDNQDWAFQIEVPYRRITSDDPSGNRDRDGLFDIKLNTGTAFRLSPTLRIGAGVEMRIPTGSNDVSLNIFRMQEYVTLAWDATPWLTLTPKIRYYHTVSRQGDATPQNYWEIFAPATFILPNRWAITTRYEIKIDRVADYTTHSAKLIVAHQFVNPALNVSLQLKVPFNSLTNDYQIVFNTSWFF